MAKFFPLTPDLPNLDLRVKEKFQVNFAHGEKYLKSTIPYCQRKLNESSRGHQRQDPVREADWTQWMAGLEDRLKARRDWRAMEGGPVVD